LAFANFILSITEIYVPSLRSYSEELQTKLRSLSKGGQRGQHKLAKELPLYVQKFAIVHHLAKGLQTAGRNAQTIEVVDFIVSQLKATNLIWLQQIDNFEQLLTEIAGLAPSVGNPGYTAECEVPVQQLKSFWLKCLDCGSLQFGRRESSKCCATCKQAFALAPLEFQEPDPLIQYNKKGQLMKPGRKAIQWC